MYRRGIRAHRLSVACSDSLVWFCAHSSSSNLRVVISAPSHLKLGVLLRWMKPGVGEINGVCVCVEVSHLLSVCMSSCVREAAGCCMSEERKEGRHSGNLLKFTTPAGGSRMGGKNLIRLSLCKCVCGLHHCVSVCMCNPECLHWVGLNVCFLQRKGGREKLSRWKRVMSLQNMNPPIYIHAFFLFASFTPSPLFFLPLLPLCVYSLVFIPSAHSVSESIHLKSGESLRRAQKGSMVPEKYPKQHTQKSNSNFFPSLSLLFFFVRFTV